LKLHQVAWNEGERASLFKNGRRDERTILEERAYRLAEQIGGATAAKKDYGVRMRKRGAVNNMEMEDYDGRPADKTNVWQRYAAEQLLYGFRRETSKKKAAKNKPALGEGPVEETPLGTTFYRRTTSREGTEVMTRCRADRGVRKMALRGRPDLKGQIIDPTRKTLGRPENNRFFVLEKRNPDKRSE